MARQIRPGQLQENVLYNISASFAISASHEITHEVSSSYAETASFANFAATSSYVINTNIPEKLHLQVRNDDVVTIPAGTPIYSTGEIGGSERIKVRIASASSADKMPSIGIAETDLTTTGNTKDGFAIINGIYNTNVTPISGTPAIGDNIYIHENSGLTTIKPSGSNLIQNIGTVLKTNGTIIQGMKVSSIDRSNDVPNLLTGNVFYGVGDQATQSPLSDIISGSLFLYSGSFSGSYEGDGSQLSGISTTPFPFTGDAVITGSLVVSGSGTQGGLRTNTRNIILGQGAGHDQNATNGPYNVMIGYQAGYTNTTGDSNVCIGQNAGYALSTNASDDNIFIGKLAGAGGTSPAARMSDANYNIALGYETMLYLTSGDSNIGFGFRTMRNISSGKYNLAYGDGALYNTDTGQNNIGIGRSAGAEQTAGTGNITIGSGSLGVAGESNQLRIGNGNTITTISASLETGDIIFASTASAEYLSTPAGNLSPISASYAVTASHALNAVASATNFTQSLFVTPNGNDGTAAVGDMLNPFHTILAATASSNIGDTIIIYPGTYPSESANIIKDGVNYYFYPGAIVHPTASLSEYIVDIQDPTYPVNVRGAGSFISDDTSYGAIRIQAEECYFEFDIAKTTNNTTNTFDQGGTVDLEPTNASSGRISTNDIKGNPFYINGKIINTGNFGTYGGALILGRNGLTDYSSLIFEGSIMQLHPTDTRPAIYVASNKTTYDFSVNANVFASASQAVYSDGRGAVRLRGIYSTGDRGNKYAIELTDGYQTHYDIDAHINGSVKLNTGDINNSGGILRGTILTGNTTPDDAAIYINGGGQHKIDNQIFMRDSGGYGIKIETDDAQVEFTGDFNADAGSSYINFCKVTTGKLIFKGSLGSKANRGNGNIINGGHLVIDSFFDNDGFNYPDNAYCFQLSAGTLEINNKVTHAYTTPGSGIVDMTGGYLKLNGAELVQLNGTGSFAYGVDLNGGSHSGSILNNSFTNLTPFGPGAFTNEITGGGTLFYSDKLY